MKTILSVLMTVLIVTAFAGNDFRHVLLYKKYGTWQTDKKPIPAGRANAGRIQWRGDRLVFTPPEKTFDLENISFFSFMIQSPATNSGKSFTLRITYTEGEPFERTFRVPRHGGWQLFYTFCGVPPRRTIIGYSGPTARKGVVKKVEFISGHRDFEAVLDDIHFIRKGLRTSFPEHLFPQVTNGCFFPEFVTEKVIAETLTDPAFNAKMAEIEKLRKKRLPLKLHPQKTDIANTAGTKLFSRILDDGTISDLTEEDGKRIHKEKNFGHDYHETWMLYLSRRHSEMLNAWQHGSVARTPENKQKIFKSLIRFLSTDMNRRGENFRYICASFVIPSMTATAYRIFFNEMEAVEKGINRDPLAIRLNCVLKEACSWCYTFPLDRPGGEFLTVESFRNSNAWTGGNFSYRPTFFTALICRNPRMIDVLAKVADGALSVTSFNTIRSSFWVDGMTADGSAWGHAPQNYPFGYPLSGMIGIGQLIKHLKGTSWEFKADGKALRAVCHYLESLLWYGTGWETVQRKNGKIQMLQRDLLTACGRIAQQYKGRQGYGTFESVIWCYDIFISLLPPESSQAKRLKHCKAAILRQNEDLPVGARYFWNNDLLLCREKDGAAAITMLSGRIKSCENAPSDSHYADFWSDGSAWINKPFDAYRIAKGFFKTTAIPGVTARQWEFTHTGSNWRNYWGRYNFAGGAANGNFAVCGFKSERRRVHHNPDMNFYDLVSSKAYFWLNGKLFCLTAGITDKTKRNVPVATTLDQTLWRAPVTYGKNQTAEVGEQVKVNTNLLWHDGIGYAVLCGKGVLSAETRTGAKWEQFDNRNKKRKDLPRSAPILMFQIDHGKNPQNDACAYMVDFRSRDFASLKRFVEKPTVEILALTPDIQAIREKSSGTLAAVFYTPGGEAGGLQVEHPAVVLLKELPDGRTQVTVSDPLQDPDRDSIALKWKNKYYRIKLPTGLYSGKPVTEFLNSTNNIKEVKMKKTTIALAVAAALSCSAQNLIRNADFRQADAKGQIAHWRYPGNTYQRVKDPETGKTVLKITLDRPENKARNVVYMHQRIAIKNAGKYQLSFTGKVADCGVINMVWSFFDKDNKRVKIPTPFWTSAIAVPGTWQTITHTLNIPEGVKYVSTNISCRVEKKHKLKTGTMFVQKVKLSPVIEKK